MYALDILSTLRLMHCSIVRVTKKGVRHSQEAKCRRVTSNHGHRDRFAEAERSRSATG